MTETSKVRKVAFVGDHLPRKCGIATFTSDLLAAVATAHPQSQCFSVSVNDIKGGYDYPEVVRFEIEEQDLSSYLRAADFLNISNVDIVCLQHEFGIFGGPVGGHILAFLRELRMPVVTTLHTVLREPRADQRRVMRELISLSTRVVVMAERGRQMLQEVYEAPRSSRNVRGTNSRRPGRGGSGLAATSSSATTSTRPSSRLVINGEEAERVRSIFQWYLAGESVFSITAKAGQAGWHNKQWTTRDGKPYGGHPLRRAHIYNLLANVLYTGQIAVDEELYPGEHEAIIDQQTFNLVQARLKQNSTAGDNRHRTRMESLLRGLIYGAGCGSAMYQTYSSSKERRYRYYVCSRAKQQTEDYCVTRSVSAPAVEDAVVESIRRVSVHPRVLEETPA